MESDEIIKTFCTTREAADQLGVSLRTVQLWSESGLLKAWKTAGGHRRVERASVERLLVRHPQPTATVASEPSLRILVVEDDLSVLRLYERKLARWPMRPSVDTATNGFDALVKIGFGTWMAAPALRHANHQGRA